MRANPKPDHRVAGHNAKRAVTICQTRRPITADLLKLHGWMTGIAQPEAVLFDRETLTA